MADSKSDILQGTLDLMVLKTLETLGPQHGYGIARRIALIEQLPAPAGPSWAGARRSRSPSS